MLNIQLICIGKLKEAYLRSACEEYCKRLTPFCRFTVTELKEARLPENPSEAQIAACLQEEGKGILARIPLQARVVAMCIEGEQRSSPQFSQLLAETMVRGFSTLVFVVGGSWGLSDAVKQRADIRLSVSKMTFPHQLFRVLLCEQVYRAFQILNDGKYHK